MRVLTKDERLTLKLSDKSHLGTMRIDWVTGSISNSWFGKVILKEVNLKVMITIQHELNELIFNQLDTFDRVLDWCGEEGYDNELLLHHEGCDVDYFIRLIPVQDTNSFVYVYLK